MAEDPNSRYLRQMINTTTANVLAMRGVVTCLAAGVEPTEERVLAIISPLLDRRNPGTREFAQIVDDAATEILRVAADLKTNGG